MTGLSWDLILEDFEDHLKKLGRTSGSITMYLSRVRRFLDYWKKSPEDLKSVERPDCYDFIYSLRTSKSTIASYISALTSFWTFLENRGLVSENVWSSVVRPKHVGPSDRPFLTLGDMTRIMEGAKKISGDSYARMRNSLLIRMSVENGPTTSEIASLQWRDIDVRRRKMRIRHSGKRRGRELPISRSLARQLSEYKKERHSSPEDNVFGLSRRSIQRIVSEIGQKTIGRAVTPRDLRRSMASQVEKLGASMNQVHSMLGLGTSEVVRRYSRAKPKSTQEAWWEAWTKHIRALEGASEKSS